MRILTLLGSARKKGNTATVLGHVEDELKRLGHEVERVDLSDRDIGGCLGCASCRRHEDRIGCVQKDDALAVLEKMVEADAVVFSSPLYFWGFTAHLKAFIDRCYSLVVNYHKPGHVSLVEGQRQALLVTGGGAYQDNAEGAFAAFDRFVAFCKARKAGELYVAGCSTPADMGPGIRDHAAEFAAQVVA